MSIKFVNPISFSKVSVTESFPLICHLSRPSSNSSASSSRLTRQQQLIFVVHDVHRTLLSMTTNEVDTTGSVSYTTIATPRRGSRSRTMVDQTSPSYAHLQAVFRAQAFNFPQRRTLHLYVWTHRGRYTRVPNQGGPETCHDLGAHTVAVKAVDEDGTLALPYPSQALGCSQHGPAFAESTERSPTSSRPPSLCIRQAVRCRRTRLREAPFHLKGTVFVGRFHDHRVSSLPRALEIAPRPRSAVSSSERLSPHQGSKHTSEGRLPAVVEMECLGLEDGLRIGRARRRAFASPSCEIEIRTKLRRRRWQRCTTPTPPTALFHQLPSPG